MSRIFYITSSDPIDKPMSAACVRHIRIVWSCRELKLISKLVQLETITPTLTYPSGACVVMPEDLEGYVSKSQRLVR
jgi:hypothetical protein